MHAKDWDGGLFKSISGVLLASTGMIAGALHIPAQAGPGPQPLTITSPFFFRSNTGPNPLGLLAGDVLQLGAFVNPSGPPTIVTANQGLTTLSLAFTPHPIFPDNYELVFPFDQALTQSWSINAQRGAETASPVVTSSITATQGLPYVENLRVVGAGLAPTLEWEWPDLMGTQGVTYGVRIIDYKTRAHFYSQWLYPELVGAAGVTGTYKIPDGILNVNESYIFRVALLQVSTQGATARATSAGYTQAPFTPSVPGPLPILGIGTVFAYSRKLRKRIKSRKQPVARKID